ncbi:MAG: dTDP-glucose 4,6-dehydratase [Vampirovibrionales bacterium]|nr:dTDP-glucose 4,6-dehydratase [Vampirovibrionales bacterium]
MMQQNPEKKHTGSAYTPKRLLITGGAGFIGSWLVKLALQRWPEAHIVTLDALTYAGNLANLEPVLNHPRHQFVKGDIADAACVKALFEQYAFDAVINSAAETHVDRSIHDASPFLKSNVLGTGVLLEAARLANGFDRFLQVSTDEVYGSIEAPARFTEASPLNPSSPYAASKASADLLVQSYAHTYGLNTLITRCTNNYGPNQYPEKLLPLMIQNALQHQALPVYGDGMNIRDWLHVRDHCRALLTVLERGTPGEVYNIGGCNEQTNLSVIKAVLKRLNRPESLITFVPDRLGHDRRYAIDAGKLSAQLGWQPEEAFEAGLDELVQAANTNAEALVG